MLSLSKHAVFLILLGRATVAGQQNIEGFSIKATDGPPPNGQTGSNGPATKKGQAGTSDPNVDASKKLPKVPASQRLNKEPPRKCKSGFLLDAISWKCVACKDTTCPSKETVELCIKSQQPTPQGKLGLPFKGNMPSYYDATTNLCTWCPSPAGCTGLDNWYAGKEPLKKNTDTRANTYFTKENNQCDAGYLPLDWTKSAFTQEEKDAEYQQGPLAKCHETAKIFNPYQCECYYRAGQAFPFEVPHCDNKVIPSAQLTGCRCPPTKILWVDNDSSTSTQKTVCPTSNLIFNEAACSCYQAANDSRWEKEPRCRNGNRPTKANGCSCGTETGSKDGWDGKRALWEPKLEKAGSGSANPFSNYDPGRDLKVKQSVGDGIWCVPCPYGDDGKKLCPGAATAAKTGVCSTKFVDCSLYGGYDETDTCQQTCKNTEKTICKGPEKDCSAYGGFDYNDPCKQTCFSTETQCITDGIDCRMFGGWDLRADPCKNVCKNQEATVCPAKYVDCSQLGGYREDDPCQQTCKRQCSKKVVDCSDRGGYDLRKDVCKQTCVMAITQTELFNQIELCFRLWKGDHLTLAETLAFFSLAMSSQGLH